MDWIFAGWLIVNVVTFCMYGLDKWKAIHGKHRISERQLLIWSAVFGGLGACLGMWCFRHKTKKPKFYLSVPFLFLLQIGIIVFLYFQY